MIFIETVRLMYESCRYEKARHINSHPAWCAVFSKEDLEVKSPLKLIYKPIIYVILQVLKYEEDLKYYYDIGYGDSFNERIGCPIVKDLITNFRYL